MGEEQALAVGEDEASEAEGVEQIEKTSTIPPEQAAQLDEELAHR